MIELGVWRVHDLAQTRACASRLAPLLTAPMRIFLSGALGAGKTFWTRAVLQAMGLTCRVPSPSYALAYSYPLVNGTGMAHHIDCFRQQGADLGDEVLELLHDDKALCFVEWPECSPNLPSPDMALRFDLDGDDSRRIIFSAVPAVAAVLRQLRLSSP